jgi:hypothetical protein
MRSGPSGKIVKSIEHLILLLEKIQSAPANYVGDTSLRKALVSQSALAAFERTEESIFASSINTQKRICAVQYSSEGGYTYLDELRTSSQDAIQKICRNTSIKSRTRDGLKLEIEELKVSLEQCRSDCLHLTNAITKAMRAARCLANDSRQAALVARWAKIDDEIYRMISIAGEKPRQAIVESK